MARALRKAYYQLSDLERRQYLKERHAQGASLAQLAAEVGCSKSLVRDQVLLASLPEDLAERYQAGKLGRKKALRAARAQKTQAHEPPATAGDQPKTPPPDAKLETAVTLKAETPQDASVDPPAAGIDAGPRTDPPQASPPPMSAEEREKEIQEWVALIVKWIALTGLRLCDTETFWGQVDRALYGGVPWLFTEEAPRRRNLRPVNDSWKYIKRCKVKRGNPNFMPDVLNNAVAWLARWTQRLIPDRAIMLEALDRAATQLIRKARKDIWG